MLVSPSPKIAEMNASAVQRVFLWELIVLALFVWLMQSGIAISPIRMHILQLALGISISGFLVFVILSYYKQDVISIIGYLMFLFVRALALSVPEDPRAHCSVFLFVLIPPVVAVDLLIGGTVTRLASVLVIAFAIIISFLNEQGMLFHSVYVSSPTSVILFIMLVLAHIGLLLAAFAGEHNPQMLRRPHTIGPDEMRTLSHGQLAEALSLVMRAGHMMLDSGAASFRTEDVMKRLAIALGVNRMDVYLTPGGIIGSAYSGTEHRTQVARVPRIGVSMLKIVELETYSHRINENAQPLEVADELNRIAGYGPIYSSTLLMLAAGAACGALAVGMGGWWKELMAAGLGALTAQEVRMHMVRQRTNPLLVNIVSAAVATFISVELVRLLNAPYPRYAVAASVLLLVPGVPLVTSIVDLSRLDLLSGVSRGALALMLFAGIAIGMLVVLLATGFNIL